MGGVEMIVLSLGLSVAVAALGLASGTLVERVGDAPRLRAGAGGGALSLPLLPPVATPLLLMTPAPVLEVAKPTLVPVVAAASNVGAAAAPASVRFASPPFDLGLVGPAILLAAGALVLLRMLILARRARRLSGLLKSGQAADEATTDLVREVSRDLQIPAPPVMVSAETTEPLLAGLRAARLVLPTALRGDAAVRRAVITHELAHLKRGDHRALWVEEAALTLLAFNPLALLLRARRSAAREEACDALALNGAGSETRRAYAQSLIEALRTRAGSQTVGVMPALTFTGAGRTTAMHRLKAVLTPATPATRRARIGASAGIAVLLAVVAGSTVAVAAQREPELLVTEAGLEGKTSMTPRQDARPDRGSTMTAPDGASAATAALDAARNALSPGQRERYRRVSAQGYRDLCASNDPGDEGFCAGVMFAQMNNAGICLTAGASADTPGGTDIYVERGRDAIRRLSPRRDEGAHEYAGRAIAEAFPCTAPTSTNRAESRDVVVWMPVSFEGNIELKPGDRMHVTLNDGSGTMLAEAMGNGGDLRVPLTEAEFLGPGQGNRAYTLNAAILRADGSVEAADEAIIVRLAPGSQRTARNMSARLSFGG